MSVPAGLAYATASQNYSIAAGEVLAKRLGVLGIQVRGLFCNPVSPAGEPVIFLASGQQVIPVAQLAQYGVTPEDEIALNLQIWGVADLHVAATLAQIISPGDVSSVVTLMTQLYGAGAADSATLRALAGISSVASALKTALE